MANHINNYFATVGLTLAEEFDNNLPNLGIPHHGFVPLFLNPIATEELSNEVNKIVIFKSSG